MQMENFSLPARQMLKVTGKERRKSCRVETEQALLGREREAVRLRTLARGAAGEVELALEEVWGEALGRQKSADAPSAAQKSPIPAAFPVFSRSAPHAGHQ